MVGLRSGQSRRRLGSSTTRPDKSSCIRSKNVTHGKVIKFYADAEAVLDKLTRRGLPMILREVDDGKSKPYSMSGMQKSSSECAKQLELRPHSLSMPADTAA